MPRYRSNYKPRSLRRSENKSKKRLVWSIIISILLLFVIFWWILPALIGQLTKLNKSNTQKTIQENIELAPPVLNIPFESTSTATINIKGYTTPNSKVQIYLDDNITSTQTSDSSGNFTTEPISLSLGTNNIYGKTLDDKDKESLPSKSIQVIYNNEKPNLEIAEPEDNKEIKGGDKKVTVRGKTDPDNDLKINGTRIIINSDGSFTTTINLNDGDNTINITATNSVDNTTTVEKKVKYTPS